MNSSKNIAEETVEALEKIINDTEWNTAKQLIDLIREKGKNMISVPQTGTIVGNIIRRVLKIIRDEYSSAQGKHEECDPQESLQEMLTAEGQVDYAKYLPSLKEAITDNLRELVCELETSPDIIAAQSLEHIHSDEVIMTAGKSRTVEKFLKSASVKRKFQVIVVEGAPSFEGRELAKSLATSGIQTTLIPDSSIFAMMSRVNKVIIGTHSVTANGGLKASCGVLTLALAAKHRSVPMIVCASVFKLTPQYFSSADEVGFNHMRSPQEILPFEEDDILSDVHVINPAYDYVPPDLVTLFITNNGGNSPSYVYRLLSEVCHPEDYDIY